MLDNVAIEVGPSRFARAFLVLLAAALAIAPATMTSRSGARDSSPVVLTHRTCATSPPDGEPTTIRRRTVGVNPRYLQRELGHDAIHAR